MKKQKEKKAEKAFSWKRELLDWAVVLLTALALAFCINTFLIANSRIPSGSMENTIMTGDRVIGFRLTYKFQDPQRGDIAIFKFPDNENDNYVKRIIGLPGDTVEIRDGHVYLNGSPEPLEEPYLKEDMEVEEPMIFEVPEDSYFMLGDNRNLSADARYWNNTYVTRDKLIAKVYFRYYPNIQKIQ